ncbi:MAG: hypothetical protein ABIW19_17960 [Vicinamibacterales bacterium]
MAWSNDDSLAGFDVLRRVGVLLFVLCGVTHVACNSAYFDSTQFEPLVEKFAALESVERTSDPPSLRGRALLLWRGEYGGPEKEKRYLGKFSLDLRNYELPGDLIPKAPGDIQTVILITEHGDPASFASYKNADGTAGGYVEDAIFEFVVVDISRSLRFETRSVRCNAPPKVSNGLTQPEFDKLKAETVTRFVKGLPRQ